MNFFSLAKTLVIILMLFFGFESRIVLANPQMSLMQALMGSVDTSLSYSTPAQTLYTGVCSNLVTVQTPSNVSSNLVVNLTGSAGMSYYSDVNCVNSITSVTITTGTKAASFYFVATNAVVNSITSTATGYAVGVQNETTNANPYAWMGGGVDANWNTNANWAGGAAPGNTNVAVFNSSCTSNCSPTINVPINIKGIRATNGYAGTITQGASTVTIGSVGIIFYGGAFLGGSADISLNFGPLIVNGGVFTSTQGTLKMTESKGGYSTFDHFIISTANSFIHNNGLVWFHISSNNYPYFRLSVASGNDFYDLRLRRDGGSTDDAVLSSTSSPTTPIVLGTMTLATSGIKGPWELRGNLVFGTEYGTYSGAEDSPFTFTGGTNQTIDNTVGVPIPTGLITVNKTAGSKITLLSNYQLSAGKNLTLLGGNIDVASFNLKVPGTLTLSAGTGIYLNSGTVTVGVPNTSLSAGAYSSGTIYAGAAP